MLQVSHMAPPFRPPPSDFYYHPYPARANSFPANPGGSGPQSQPYFHTHHHLHDMPPPHHHHLPPPPRHLSQGPGDADASMGPTHTGSGDGSPLIMSMSNLNTSSTNVHPLSASPSSMYASLSTDAWIPPVSTPGMTTSGLPGPSTASTSTSMSSSGTGAHPADHVFDPSSVKMEPVQMAGEVGSTRRKRNSAPEASSSAAPAVGGGLAVMSQPRRSSTMTGMPSPDIGSGQEDDEGKSSMPKKSRSSSTNIAMSGLTSCEACRKGKRRCEPSPLVPPDHPDVAKLPCARCRRFALECVRVRVVRRKGPAPVDLSAISDAVHGFRHPEAGSSTDSLMVERRQSGMIPEATAPMESPGIGGASGSKIMHSPFSQSSIGGDASLPTSLDQVVPAAMIDTVIGLFFDFVYPLTPCLHKPTFLSDLTARKDRTDPIFFSLTLMVLASTLVQTPRSLVNLDKQEVEALVRRCVKVGRAKLAYIWDDPSPIPVELVVICYLEGIVHLILGNNTAHVMCTAQANQCALSLGLNEESSYEGLSPIESEVRRRIYWLLFQADKSSACLRARPIGLRLDDSNDLRLPAEVDDEQITATGIRPQPIGRTPIVAGFNIVTTLFKILNDALVLQRRKSAPSVDSILADLQNVNNLRERVMNVALDVATPLQMRPMHNSRAASPAQDWESKLQARFEEFFAGGTEPDHVNSFLVLQGNILVTQKLVRLVLLQTRDSLFQQLGYLTQMPTNNVGGAMMAGMQSESPEDIACDLLDGLNSLPVECVATNGPSLVQKIRFVAIQLMECSTSQSSTAARAQNLLMQFLSVLSVIESMYSFGRDVSAE